MQLAITETKGDNTRTIVLVHGELDRGGPYWVLVAVKPSKYAAFIEEVAKRSFDMRKFAPLYGEIIVSDEGNMPPDEIIAKVGEMYQTNPDIIRKAIGTTRWL